MLAKKYVVHFRCLADFLSLCLLGNLNLHAFLSSAVMFFKINVLKKSFSNIIRVSVKINIRPDLGSNILQKLKAGDTFIDKQSTCISTKTNVTCSVR